MPTLGAAGSADRRLRLTLSDGDQGEILISGPQVAAGYWGDPNLSAQKFRNGTFYTGDYAERIDGELYFLGRRDDMVKLRGHRIHLGEIRAGAGAARLSRVACFCA